MCLWDADSGTLLGEPLQGSARSTWVTHPWQGRDAFVRSVAFDHYCLLLAAVSNDNCIKIWRVSAVVPVHPEPGADNHAIPCPVSDARPGENIPGPVLRNFIVVHAGYVTAVSFSPDSQMVLGSCSDGFVRVWDAVRGTMVAAFSGHAGVVWDAVWSNDGKRVASAGYDSSVCLWWVDERVSVYVCIYVCMYIHAYDSGMFVGYSCVTRR